MIRVAFTRNLVRLAKPSLVNQFERQFSQLRASTRLVSSLDTFLKPTTTTTVVRDFCSEASKKKKPKKNPPAVDHVGRLDLRIGTVGSSKRT